MVALLPSTSWTAFFAGLTTPHPVATRAPSHQNGHRRFRWPGGPWPTIRTVPCQLPRTASWFAATQAPGRRGPPGPGYDAAGRKPSTVPAGNGRGLGSAPCRPPRWPSPNGASCAICSPTSGRRRRHCARAGPPPIWPRIWWPANGARTAGPDWSGPLWPATPTRSAVPSATGRRGWSWSPPSAAGLLYCCASVDGPMNTIEFFIHVEDVRRAQPEWEPRPLAPELADALWAAARSGRDGQAASPAPSRSPHRATARRRAGVGPGSPWPAIPASSRCSRPDASAAARVEISGDAELAARLRDASLGI